jgi:putative ABC transport system permease protein
LGLSVGFEATFLLSSYIVHEFSYDRYHKYSDRIHRVVHNWKTEENITPWARTSAPIGPMLEATYAEIELMTRVRKNPRTDLLQYKEKKFNENSLIFADSAFFKIFSFKLKSGSAERVLSEPNSIVLSEAMARKYFGNEDPMGKFLMYNNSVNLMVTGIMDQVPDNSHFTFDFVVTFSTLQEVIGEMRLNHWGWFDHQTYLLMEEGTDMYKFEASLGDFLKNHAPEWLPERMELFLQPLASIHLRSNLKDELETNSKPEYSYVLAVIGIFILFMAGINFINMATAKYSERSLEIGIRKIMGEQRRQLIKFYLFESAVFSFLSFLISIILVIFSINWFNEITGKSISLYSQISVYLFLALSIVSLIFGFLAGIYPALFLSALKPVSVLKGNIIEGIKTDYIRKILVIFQFFISILMLVSTLVVSRQLNFLQNTKLGFTEQHVIILPIKDRSQNNNYESIRQQLLSVNGVKEVSFSSSMPGSNNSMTFTYRFPESSIEEQPLATFMVDEYFTDLFDIKLVSGISFNKVNRSDSISHVIINESAVQFFNLDNPVGSLIQGNASGKVIAVIKDFNIKSLHDKLEPTILFVQPAWFRYIAVKIDNSDTQEILSGLEKKWAQIYPGELMEFSFMEDDINNLYRAEIQLRKAFEFFTIISILIAALGLLGLGSFILDRRTKEIGIRKVLGSTSGKIFTFISKDFLKLIGMATLIAWPISYYLMNNWLQTFPYKADLTWFVFVLPVIIMTGLLGITIGYQVLKASNSNPVKVLRNE